MSSLTKTVIAIAMALTLASPSQARELTDGEKLGAAIVGGILFLGIMSSAGKNNHRPQTGQVYAPPQHASLPAKQRAGGYQFYYLNPLKKAGYTCNEVNGTLWPHFSWNGDKQVQRNHCYVGRDQPDADDTYFDGRFRRTYDGKRWLNARTNTWEYGTPRIARDRDRDDRHPWGHDDRRRADRDRDRDRSPDVGTVWMDGPYSCGTKGWWYDRDAKEWQRDYPPNGRCR